ncbi:MULTISPECIES: hypothetical protein [unclassified Duganella]|uniref:hypothetical protein n=1 Tax=unclassified Duganella TaxID=2636909 RepID=UPI000E345F5F|nr:MULTISPECIES: hypothetical protein [unclassified Duganella]RFP14704.1 hypothetical protein D0T23_11920 [Duganella sp. BJB475]RFP31052.1 hypothetical protein D0T21_14300 [Duganella sp. BJB476]
MDIRFDITAGFDADLVKFSASDRKLIAAKLNRYSAMLDESGSVPSSRFFRRHTVVLPGALESSLYSLRINERIHVVLTMEHDPVFERVVWTLLRVVSRSGFDQAIESAIDLLYPDLSARGWQHA